MLGIMIQPASGRLICFPSSERDTFARSSGVSPIKMYSLLDRQPHAGMLDVSLQGGECLLQCGHSQLCLFVVRGFSPDGNFIGVPGILKSLWVSPRMTTLKSTVEIIYPCGTPTQLKLVGSVRPELI